jgi:nucleoside-diphosphate-sugar epimerase
VPPQWIQGSLSDPDSLKRLVHNATVVIHCAGAIRGSSADSFNRVNVDGVARLVQITRGSHHKPRFLLLSSLAAREPQLSDYARSKRRGEEALADQAGGMPFTILRPPAVYGPGDRAIRLLIAGMRHGWVPVAGPEDARFSLIYVEDLAEAVAALLEQREWLQGPFELDDGRPGGYRWPDVLAAAGRVCGRRVRGLRVPRPILAWVAGANLGLARLLGYDPLLTPGKVRELTYRDWVCDNAAFSRASGWAPRTMLDAGLAMTMEATGLAARNAKGMAENAKP